MAKTFEIISRADAKAKGFKRYFTGRPCSHGHLFQRLVSNGGCAECYRFKRAELHDKQRLRTGRTKKFERDANARSKAKAAGLDRYFTGKPCIKGHLVERRVDNGACVECTRIWANLQRTLYPERVSSSLKKWKLNNPEWSIDYNRKPEVVAKNRQRLRAHRAANLMWWREYGKQQYAKDPKRRNASSRKWKDNHPEYKEILNKRLRERYKENPLPVLTRNRQRRALERGAIGSHSVEDIQWLLMIQNNRCAEPTCKNPKFTKKNTPTLDHIISLTRGGSNNKRNLQMLCRSCNSRKYNCDPIDFAQRNGRLL